LLLADEYGTIAVLDNEYAIIKTSANNNINIFIFIFIFVLYDSI
jgi:hypothetical protein